jgi:hypothetical protein
MVAPSTLDAGFAGRADGEPRTVATGLAGGDERAADGATWVSAGWAEPATEAGWAELAFDGGGSCDTSAGETKPGEGDPPLPGA